MVSTVSFFRNDLTGELFETPLKAIDSEFKTRHSTQRGACSERTEDW